MNTGVFNTEVATFLFSHCSERRIREQPASRGRRCAKRECVRRGGSRSGRSGMGNSFQSERQIERRYRGSTEREASKDGKGLEKITGEPI